MGKKKLFLAGMFGAALAFALVFTACGGEEENISTSTASATLPVITVHPTSKVYASADDFDLLSVEATVRTGSEVLTYQWYSNTDFKNTDGTPIAGETSSTFQPTAAGIYYVVVTNTHPESHRTANQASNPALVTVRGEAPPIGGDDEGSSFLASFPGENPTATITVDGSDKHQFVRGFGGMSNAFGIGAPAQYMQMRDIDTLFHPETGLGFNFLRIKIFYEPLDEVVSGMVYPEMGNGIYYEIVKRVNQYGGYVLASPWTMPAEWKQNESIDGVPRDSSYLLPLYYPDYANYLRTFARDMAAQGAPIYALTVQNEATYPAEYEGSYWSAAQHQTFFRDYGHLISKSPSPQPGYGGGKATPRVLVGTGEPHNDITWNASVINDATARGNADIVTYHTYGSKNSRWQPAFDNQKENWMTEYNINSGNEDGYYLDSTWNFVWRFADYVDHVIRVNDTHAFVWWYAKRFYNFIGDGAFGTNNGDILPRGYVLSHWAKFATDTIRVGAAITGHTGNSEAAPTGDTAPNVRVNAFMRYSAPNADDWEEGKLAERIADGKVPAEDSVSLVVYDQRQRANIEPTDIRIQLPEGFAATSAYAIISDVNRKQVAHPVVLAEDGTYGDLRLPANSIISVKFVK